MALAIAGTVALLVDGRLTASSLRDAAVQVFFFPLFDGTELWTIKRFPQLELEERPIRRFFVRTAIRWAYVLSTAFLGCLIPFFGALMNLIGAVAITPTTFVLPPILWLYWKRPGRNTFDYWLAIVVAVLMTIIGVVGTAAALRSIVNRECFTWMAARAGGHAECSDAGQHALSTGHSADKGCSGVRVLTMRRGQHLQALHLNASEPTPLPPSRQA